MFALSQNSAGPTKPKRSMISRVLRPCQFGLMTVTANIIAGLFSFLTGQDVDLINSLVFNSILYFFMITYVVLLLQERIQEKIMNVLSPLCKKIISKLHYWFFALIGWYIFLFVGLFIINQFPEFASIFMLINYSLYAILGSLFVFSLAVFIPTAKYLASSEKNSEERKSIADSVTFLTPLLGFPWAFTAYSIWSFFEILPNPFWIIYALIFIVYLIIFFAFVHFPYYTGAFDKKKMDLETLEKSRNELLKKLQNVGNNKNQDLLKKLLMESEIGRIDREKQVVEARSLHPYKLIIPAVSLTVTIFVALLIELLRDNLPQLIS